MFEYLQRTDSLDESEVRDLLLRFYSKDKEYFYKITLNGETHTIPLVTRTQWLDSERSINNILGTLMTQKSSDYDDEFLSIYKENLAESNNRDSNIWNGNVYRLIRANENEIHFSFEVTDYFSYLYDCFRLAVETYDSIVQKNHNGENISGKLPIRNKTAKNVNSLMSFNQRYCKLGVSTLVALNPSNFPLLTIFNRRSDSVAEHPNKYHVGPAGSFEPVDDTEFKNGYDLQSLVVREFREEILSGLSDKSAEINLSKALNQRKAELWVTGFGVELLRGQPELTTLLVFRNDLSDKIVQNINPNWEFESQSYHSQITHKLNDVKLIRKAISENAVPAAAMAVCQGLQTLSEQYNDIHAPVFKITNP